MHDAVQRYYSSVVNQTADLQTDVGTSISRPPPRRRAGLCEIHREVRDRYYGCDVNLPFSAAGGRAASAASRC